MDVLRALGVHPPKVRTAVEFIIAKGAGVPEQGTIGLTERAKGVVELAVDEARRQNRPVGSEHLLLACIREAEGIAAGVLGWLGVTLDEARAAALRLASERAPEAPEGRPHQSIRAEPMPGGGQDIAATRELAHALAAVTYSPLRRVVAIGQVADDAGVSVECLALEVRQGGCLLYWKAHPHPERRLGTPEITVSDDAGTDYRAWGLLTESDGRESKGEIMVVPTPPDRATTMVARWTGFAAMGATPGARDAVPGTWRFEFPLHP